MVFPIGDAPNPKGAPIVTYLLIAANVAVFLLISVPLGSQRPPADDPGLLEYLRVMSHAVPDRVARQQVNHRRVGHLPEIGIEQTNGAEIRVVLEADNVVGFAA